MLTLLCKEPAEEGSMLAVSQAPDFHAGVSDYVMEEYENRLTPIAVHSIGQFPYFQSSSIQTDQWIFFLIVKAIPHFTLFDQICTTYSHNKIRSELVFGSLTILDTSIMKRNNPEG